MKTQSMVCIQSTHNSEKQADHRLIEIKYICEGEVWEFISRDYKIIFINAGNLNFSMGMYSNKNHISEGQAIFVPKSAKFKGMAAEHLSITIVRIKSDIRFTNIFHSDNILQPNRITEIQKKKNNSKLIPDSNKPLILDLNDMLRGYFYLLNQCLLQGVDYPNYMENKIQELIYIMHICFRNEELTEFFDPLISSDRIFSDFIYSTYRQIKTEKELADLSFYSISGFRKRFFKIFGVSPSHWLKEKKAEDILLELCMGAKSAKQISFEYSFCSPAHFNDFCKHYLGGTPGEIRERKILNEKLYI